MSNKQKWLRVVGYGLVMFSVANGLAMAESFGKQKAYGECNKLLEDAIKPITNETVENVADNIVIF